MSVSGAVVQRPLGVHHAGAVDLLVEVDVAQRHLERETGERETGETGRRKGLMRSWMRGDCIRGWQVGMV